MADKTEDLAESVAVKAPRGTMETLLDRGSALMFATIQIYLYIYEYHTVQGSV